MALAKSKVTSQGQISAPVAVREKLGDCDQALVTGYTPEQTAIAERFVATGAWAPLRITSIS
jgi:hypothetical protein